MKRAIIFGATGGIGRAIAENEGRGGRGHRYSGRVPCFHLRADQTAA